MAEQSIRVTARGEFGQLSRGLKQLQGDLRTVVGEVNRGARKGGFFDDSQIRALDVFSRRFRETMRTLDEEFKKQNSTIDEMHQKMQRATRSERDAIQQNITQRERELDVIRKQMMETERMYNRHVKEAHAFGRRGTGNVPALPTTTFGSIPTHTQNAEAVREHGRAQKDLADATEDATDSVSAFKRWLDRTRANGTSPLPSAGQTSRVQEGRSSGGGLVGSAVGLGKFVLGMAGLTGIVSLAQESYRLAYARQVDSLDLGQRLRGSAGWAGSSTSMWDQAGAIGRSNRMGYSTEETWGLIDQYTRAAGPISGGQVGGLLRFARGYGLNTSEVSSLVGGNRALGGSTTPTQFADAIAASVAESGMTTRIAEVMETNNTLLSQMNTTLKDGSARQILAYQTTLDRIGMARGMQQLTGAQGANILGGLGGIFQPGEDKWKWMGIRALQGYNPGKYGNMDLFGLEMSYEDGLLNPDNIPAMAQYIKGISGGNTSLSKRIMQTWLTDGGYAATKREASEFYDATDGLRVFSPDAMSKLSGIDSGAAYGSREGSAGQQFMDTDARFEHLLEQVGGPLVEGVMAIKEGAVDVGEAIINGIAGDASLSSILAFMREHLTGLATVLSIGNLGEGLTRIFGNGDDSLVSQFKSFFGIADDKPSLYESLPGTPQQRTQYMRELEMEQRTSQNSTEAVGAALWQRAANGEKLSDEDMQKVFQYNTDHFKAGKQMGTIETPMVDTLATGAAGFFQQAAQIITSEFGKVVGSEGGGDSDIGRMPREVTNKVEDMRESGQFTFQGMGRETKSMAQDAASKYTSMNRTTTDFKDSAIWLFRTMYYKVSNIMEYIYGEHRGLKDYLASVLGGVGGFGSTMRTGGYSGTSSVVGNSGVTAQQLNARLGGKLSGQGAAFISAGQQYGVDPVILASIAMHETGNGTSNAINSKNNVGGMMGRNGLMTFGSVQEGIDAMARNLGNNYVNQGYSTIEQIQRKYAPIGAQNDPDNLNNHWTSGVVKYANSFGLGGSVGSGSGFFSDWSSKISSSFGDKESFRKKAHGGLDLRGAQGTPLEALAGGTVAFIKMDDGGALDEDGKKNTRAGGTEVGIRMDNGNTYYYSHLSAVNPSLRVGQQIQAGMNIGAIGGKPGAAGSGYSTTGSHLHLGYMDRNGTLMNPEQLLNSLSAGDSSIGSMPSSSARSEIDVTLNISGEGASALNKATVDTLTRLVKSIVAEDRRQQLRMSPVRRGY